VRIERVPAARVATPTWPPVLATRGRGGRTSPHAHHAMHFVLALDGELEVRAGGRRATAPGVLTRPDERHALDAQDRDVLLVFVDPESDIGAVLLELLVEPVRLIDDATRRALIAADPMALMQGGGDGWMRDAAARLGLTAPGPRPPVHPRVRRVLRHLQSGSSEADASLDALAAIAGLSPGRLMHAFTASVGIPLRPYLAWLRLQRAAGEIVRGAPLSSAAAAAGFSDAAHMSRTFRRMLGMAPSMLQPPGPRS
jgi:AraC-like DNA-binding protein